MKICSYILLFSLLSLIVSSLSWANSDTVRPNDFIHCLVNNSKPSFPIVQAIYTPQNPSFSSVFEMYARDLRFLTPNHSNPIVIVAAMHESHVQATVVCSKAHGLLLRTRSGGHDYEGLSYVANVPYVILDMFNLRSMSIDMASETMWVQSGATLGELYHYIANHSRTLTFPAGLCPTVGVGGHFSGGGFGTLVRKYGLANDNVLDAQVVDVNGSVLDRKAMGEDFFWAINGGGGASFGVVLSWKIKLVRVPPAVTVLNVTRTTEVTELARRWQDVAPTTTDDLFIRLVLQPVNKKIQLTFLGLYLGNIETLLPLMKESFPELELKREECTETSWIESALLFYDYPKGTSVDALLSRNDVKHFNKLKSDYVKEAISNEGLEDIWQKMIQIGQGAMKWNPYGGQMSRIPSSQTPPPQRAGYLFKIQYLISWNENGKEDYYFDLSRKLFDAMTPYVTKSPREAFLNYRDLDIGNSPALNATYEEAKGYGMKYFNENFDRLVQVKTRVDPVNFFRNEQSIPVSPKRMNTKDR